MLGICLRSGQVAIHGTDHRSFGRKPFLQPMNDPLTMLAPDEWGGDLRPTNAICELFDFLDYVLFWGEDRDGQYRWVNVANVLNFGFNRREEMLGRTDQDLCSPHIAAHFRLDDEMVLAGQRVIHRIELVDYHDHTARWCVTCKLPVTDRHGKIIGTTGISRPLKPGAADWEGMPLGKAVSQPQPAFWRTHPEPCSRPAGRPVGAHV